jgi:hypothetical protein
MNPVVLTITDRTGAGKIIGEMNISLKTNRVTVKQIIEARVEAEVERYNAKLPEYFNGLVQPTDAEKTLNGYKMKQRKKVDAEKQIYVALDAFLKNGYFVLVDNFQADSLEQEIMITPQTQISFLKLTPLVGG